MQQRWHPQPDFTAIDAATKNTDVKIFQIHRFAASDEAHISRLARWAEIPENSKILDLGSGTGEMARLWPTAAAWTLVNLSALQLDMSPVGVTLLQCNMQNVPVADESFDAVTCCFAIGHADAPAVFLEIMRVLRPGGISFVYDMVSCQDNLALRELQYQVSTRKVMEANAHPLALDFYLEPSDDGSFGEKTLGANFNVFFQSTKPAIWRFIKK